VRANAADALPALLESGLGVDVLTDQTSAHDPLNGYVPAGLGTDEAAALRHSDPNAYIERSRESMARHCAAMVAYQARGAEVFDYGNVLRKRACSSRDFPRGSAGWGRESGTSPGCDSTISCAAARWRRPSSSAAIISTAARSPRHIERPRRCVTAATPSPTGPCSTRCS